MRTLALRLVCAGLTLAALLSAEGEQQFAALGDLKLSGGAVLRGARIGYRTYGQLNAERSNAILFPTWFGGSSADLAAYVGPGKMLDPARWFVILADALGNGVSTSPSNSRLQPRSKFPAIAIADMVESQRLLLDSLKIGKLHAVIGISMGGMQTFEWITRHPDRMAKAIPIVGTPAQTAWDLLLWNTQVRAIEGHPAWRGGEYRMQPAEALRTVAGIHALAITTPEHRISATGLQEWPAYLAGIEKNTVSRDANNRLVQLKAMMGQNLNPLAEAAAKVRAQTLVVVALQDHMVHPGPSLEFARLRQAPTLESNAACGHLIFECDGPRVTEAVRAFLER